MSINYDKNKEKIINDYYKLIGAFYNCKLIYENKNLFEIKPTDTEDERKIKVGREEDLLSELGKVGEKLFKYILGLEYLNISPNSDEYSFESFFRKSSSLKEFAKKHEIDENDDKLIELINYNDANNQKAHNFDYWLSVIEVTMPLYFEKIQKFLVYTEQSRLLINYCIKTNDFYEFGFEFEKQVSLPFKASVFPKIVMNGDVHGIPNITEKQAELLLKTNREAIRKSGDIFTRYRYASNNLDNVKIDIDEVYSLINNLITFVTMIHDNKDDLNFDLDVAYTKFKAMGSCHLVDLNKEEINKKINLDLGIINYEEVLLDRDYTAYGIERLLKYGIPKEKLLFVFGQGIHANDIEYFSKIGINNIYEMSRLKDQYIETGIMPLKKI